MVLFGVSARISERAAGKVMEGRITLLGKLRGAKVEK